VAIINGGDGDRPPTQGMLDMLTIHDRHKGGFNLSVAIVGTTSPFAGCPLEHARAENPGLPGHPRDQPKTLLPIGIRTVWRESLYRPRTGSEKDVDGGDHVAPAA
jgi:hypothetical protein